MKFKTVKYIAGGLLFAAMALIIIGLLTLEKASTAYNAVFVIVILMIAAALILIAVWGRCPHCGKRLMSKFFKWENCPYCSKPLK